MSTQLSVPTVPAAAPSGTDVVALTAAVNALDGNEPDAVLIDQITHLERLKSSCAAAQARLTHTFTVSQTTDGAARNITPDLTRGSIAGQIALARHDSRYHGARHLGAAHALVTEMPRTLAAMATGDLSERRAHLVIEQFGCLTPTDRRRADTLLAPAMAGLSNRTAQSRAAAIAYQLDPESVMGKIRGAVTDRNVTLRPAPDTMSRLSALLPVAQGVAVWAALLAAAHHATAPGDPRRRGQVMADHLIAKVTGAHLTGCDPHGVPHYAPRKNTNAETDNETDSDSDSDSDVVHSGQQEPTTVETDSADDKPAAPADTAAATTDEAGTAKLPTHPRRTPDPTGNRPAHTAGLNINLIMTDRTLLSDDDAPAHLQSYGPIPAALARALVIGHADHPTRTWIRRLYTDPHTGQLAAMDSRQRLFPDLAKKFLLARDHTCRTPWCDAPIRHLDHITPHNQGGPTHTDNGQGLCQACNHTKQAPQWRTTITPDGTTHTRTPTGHTHPSNAPPPPKSHPWPTISILENRLVDIFLDAA